MNIFAVSDCPAACAEALDDKRVVKMVLETCQMLSAAVERHGGTPWYKTTHANHPCTLWVGETRENYLWTVKLFWCLLDQYDKRFDREHACMNFLQDALDAEPLVPEGPRTPFADCSGVEPEFWHKSVHMRYQECLKRKWVTDKRTPTWRNAVTN